MSWGQYQIPEFKCSESCTKDSPCGMTCCRNWHRDLGNDAHRNRRQRGSSDLEIERLREAFRTMADKAIEAAKIALLPKAKDPPHPASRPRRKR